MPSYATKSTQRNAENLVTEKVIGEGNGGVTINMTKMNLKKIGHPVADKVTGSENGNRITTKIF